MEKKWDYGSAWKYYFTSNGKEGKNFEKENNYIVNEVKFCIFKSVLIQKNVSII